MKCATSQQRTSLITKIQVYMSNKTLSDNAAPERACRTHILIYVGLCYPKGDIPRLYELNFYKDKDLIFKFFAV